MPSAGRVVVLVDMGDRVNSKTKMASSQEDVTKAKKKRMFINHVDSYHGKNLSKFLSRCVVGASLEEQEEEEDDSASVISANLAAKEGCWEIVGTLTSATATKPDCVKEIISYDNKDQLYEFLVECDVIVYDITDDPDQIDEAVWAVSELHSDLEKIEKPKMFILISTVMTWDKSKPLDPDDPEIPFTEDDYRRRKPHPNFKEHISAEKRVTKLGKTNKHKLVTYVVAAGLTYGAEENIFHYLFKTAWHNAPELSIFGNGQNVIPTIHVKDLAAVIQNIADSRPKVRYLIAKDDAASTLEEIVKAVSLHLGTDKVKNLSKEEALANTGSSQSDFDLLMVNLRMDAVHCKESMKINWVCEAGLVENITQVITEYKDSRKLQPLRVCILGPPGSGKTTVTTRICNMYKLHQIKIKDVIDEAYESLSATARRADADDQEDDDGKAQDAQELLDTINEGKEGNNGRVEDQYVIRFFRDKLLSMPCQNQGFILDGFPKTLEQARELFASEDDDEPEEASKFGSYNKQIMPEFVISLEATDDFLKQRIMNLPESQVMGTHNTEEGLNRRLDQFRSLNTEEETVLNYFDELEFHPEKIDVTVDKTPHMLLTAEKVSKILGKPRNYGPTAEEIEENRILEEQLREKKREEERLDQERREVEEAAEKKRRQDEWTHRLNEVKREEYELLEAQSIPLRNYLMKHVMPTLTQGLIECCKTRPEDAIDYLAEYLFQNNPQVD